MPLYYFETIIAAQAASFNALTTDTLIFGNGVVSSNAPASKGTGLVG